MLLQSKLCWVSLVPPPTVLLVVSCWNATCFLHDRRCFVPAGCRNWSTGKEISKPADTFDEFSWLIFYLRLFAFFCFNFFYEQFQQLFLCAYTIVHSGEKFLHNFFLVSENLFSHNRTNKSFIYCTMFFEKFLYSSYINMNFRYTPHTFYFQKAWHKRFCITFAKCPRLIHNNISAIHFCNLKYI